MAGGIVGGALGGLTGALKSVWNDLTGNQIELFFKDSEQASFDLGLKSNYYLDGTPRFKFQYFAKIKFNDGATDATGQPFVPKFLNADEIAMLVPLTCAVDLPEMKVDTNKLNQYNHNRLAQTKVNFQPVSMEMYDVTDGKTLRFWEMYYEYYFKESLKNIGGKEINVQKKVTEKKVNPIVTFITGIKGNKGVDEKTAYERKVAYNLNEDVADTSNVLEKSDVYNRDYGYNIDFVKDNKHLIDYIEIYQYHAQRWSMVRLIRPVITNFKPDQLSFSEMLSVMKMKYTFEYEYAVYHNFFTPFDVAKPDTGLFGDIKTFFGAGDSSAIVDPTGAMGSDGYFKNANYLDMEGVSNTSSDFKVRQRFAGETPSLPESAGELRNNSLLGNLISDAKDIVGSAPGKVGNSVATAVTTGKWEQPFNGHQIASGFSNTASSGVKNVKSRNFGATRRPPTGSVADVRRK